MSTTAHLIIEYRYLILIPLAIIEGPIVAFIAGTLATLGYFNIYELGIFFFVRDVAVDAIYYSIGYYGGKTTFAKRMLAKIKVTEDHLDGVRKLWEHHPLSTMFIGKLSYGVGSTFVTVAGMVKFRFATFFKYGAIVAIVQYWSLLALGYFYGNTFGGSIANVLSNIQYVIAALGIVVTIYYIFSWRMRSKFMKETEAEESGIKEKKETNAIVELKNSPRD
jgi:membrane protein DedA with SNARE-associated domain